MRTETDIPAMEKAFLTISVATPPPSESIST
jgi:hypothetical protein